MKTPKLPVPTPLRGIDTEYTKDSIARRLIEILQRTLTENELPKTAVAKLTSLLKSIPHGQIRYLSEHLAPELDIWQADIKPYLGQNWLEAPWFFVETYFYRQVIAAIDHFRSGIDPFAHQKRQSLRATAPQTQALLHQANQLITNGWHPSSFRQLLLADLWGNQADMSMWAANDAAMPNHAKSDDQIAFLLADDTTAVVQLLQNHVRRVDFIIDNAGFELIGDLCLTDYLLSTKQVGSIFYHLKLFPTFVSDATPFDVESTVAFLNHHDDPILQATGQRLTDYLVNGRLQLITDPFWTSPHPLWHLPPTISQQLASANLVISKGDANYRRALGDAPWPHTTRFTDIVCYLPTPTLFLRTCKSEVLAGISTAQAAKMAQLEEDWLVNGRWGVVQLA